MVNTGISVHGQNSTYQSVAVGKVSSMGEGTWRRRDWKAKATAPDKGLTAGLQSWTGLGGPLREKPKKR